MSRSPPRSPSTPVYTDPPLATVHSAIVPDPVQQSTSSSASDWQQQPPSPHRRRPLGSASIYTSSPSVKRTRTSSPVSDSGSNFSTAPSENYRDSSSVSVVSAPHASLSGLSSPPVSASPYGYPGTSKLRQPRRSALDMSDDAEHPATSLGSLLDNSTAMRLEDASDQDMNSPPDYMPSAVPDEELPPLTEQHDQIQALAAQPLKPGQTCFLISSKWLAKWRADDGQSPGPVDCSDLLVPPSATGLSPGLRAQEHYEILDAEAWEQIVKWYGLKGPTIPREVVIAEDSGQPVVDVYPTQIIFILAGEEAEQPHAVPMAASATLTDIVKLGAQAIGRTGSESQIRLWLPPSGSEEVSKTQSHVPALQLRSQQYKLFESEADLPLIKQRSKEQAGTAVTMVLETANADGQWPSDSAASASGSSGVRGLFARPAGQDSFSRLQQNNAGASPTTASGADSASAFGAASSSMQRITRSQTAHDRSSGAIKGLKGLQNLGNTCFMNSALQCLSNTPELKEYFVTKVFEQEINSDNPLGNGGALASAFGSLIQQLWSGAGSSFTPRDFKWSLARFAPQFSGYAQQDTQELLAFLLDGLHEDLNRIQKKPYIEAPDWEGGGLEDMVRFAKRQWDIYKMRNDSVIVDLFQGQYRSTLVCPVCAKVSIKFDPFMYLTLPLPNKTMWRHQVYFVSADPQTPIKAINMMLSSDSSIAKLKQTLADMMNISSPQKLIGAELYSHNVYRYYYDYEPVHLIERGDHAWFWELSQEYTLPASGAADRPFSSMSYAQEPRLEEESNSSILAEVQKEESVTLPVFTYEGNGSYRERAFGPPFWITLTREEANDRTKIMDRLIQAYIRVSSDAQELQQRHEHSKDPYGELLPADGNKASTQSSWEIVDQPSRRRSSSGDVVAEVRADGQVTESRSEHENTAGSNSEDFVRVVGDDESAGQGMDPSKVSNGRTSQGPTAEPVFEARFVVNFSKVMKEADSWRTASEPLEARAQRLAEQPGDETFPLVYGKGGGIVCVWDTSVASELLMRPESTGVWGEGPETVDDPRVTEEKAEIESGARKRKGKKELNIEDCLDEFTREEQLGAEDPWYCPQCKEFRQATKKFDLWKVPDILVVHLKRFSAGRGLRDKIDISVDFPIDGLDLTDRVEGSKAVQQLGHANDSSASQAQDAVLSASTPSSTVEAATDAAEHGEDLSASILSAISEANDNAVASDKPIYDLFAVDNHYGGLGGGHYTSSARNAEDGKWYYFDDSHVRPLSSSEEVKGPAAYVLFYRRRTARAIGGKSREIVKMASATPSGTSSRAEPSGDTLSGSGLGPNPFDGDLLHRFTTNQQQQQPLVPSKLRNEDSRSSGSGGGGGSDSVNVSPDLSSTGGDDDDDTFNNSETFRLGDSSPPRYDGGYGSGRPSIDDWQRNVGGGSMGDQ
ncbi:unnamed protein product [Jaminaea pallidilutea]